MEEKRPSFVKSSNSDIIKLVSNVVSEVNKKTQNLNFAEFLAFFSLVGTGFSNVAQKHPSFGKLGHVIKQKSTKYEPDNHRRTSRGGGGGGCSPPPTAEIISFFGQNALDYSGIDT